MAKYNQTRVIARMAEVAKEYGMSFNDVVKGFADDGIGFTAMCNTLGFSEYTMMPWRDLFPKQAKRVKVERPWARDMVINRAVKVEGLRLTEIAERYNIPRETVRRRFLARQATTIAEIIKPYKRQQPQGSTKHWKGLNYGANK
jgi:orotate phosphoribosyltransferase-like protein